jgi:hypothetical protein
MKITQSILIFITVICLCGSISGSEINVVYPESYGARGDDTVDDAAAINSAITAAGPGGTVWLSLDNYYCQTPIVVSNGARFQYSNTPMIRPSISHTPSADGVRYDGTGNVKTSLPILSGFTGTALEIRNCGVINMDVQHIDQSGIAFKLNSTNSSGTGTNTVRIQFISACNHGIFITSDNVAGRVMQGNDVYVNFFTGTEAVTWDALTNVPSWDGNTFGHFD